MKKASDCSLSDWSCASTSCQSSSLSESRSRTTLLFSPNMPPPPSAARTSSSDEASETRTTDCLSFETAALSVASAFFVSVPRNTESMLLLFCRELSGNVLMDDRCYERLVREPFARSLLFDETNVALSEAQTECLLFALFDAIRGNCLPLLLFRFGNRFCFHIRILDRLDEIALFVVEVFHVVEINFRFVFFHM